MEGFNNSSMDMVSGSHDWCNGVSSCSNVEALPVSGATVPPNRDVTRANAEGGCRVPRRAKVDVENAASACRGCKIATAVAAVAIAREPLRYVSFS